MKLQAGVFIKSTEALNNTPFSGATIFITEYHAGGAAGFVINRPFGRSLHQLEAFRHGRPFPLYYGGPVDEEHLFFLHRQPGSIEGGTPVAGGIYFGGDFGQAVAGINNGQLSAADIRIFIGYCGWDAGELEAELAEGSWVIAEESEEALFGSLQ